MIIEAARGPKLSKPKRGERRYVHVVDKRDGKKYRVLTSVLKGEGFPVIYESPGNEHRKGSHRGMLLTHGAIKKGEVHASRAHFEEARKRLTNLEHQQGLQESERSRFYPATLNEIEAQEKPMSTLTDFMAVHTLEAKAAKKPATKPHAVRRAGHQAPKPKTAVKGAPPAAKSMAGLQRKLDAIAKKYVKDCPKLTIAIKEYKNKQNAIIVTGIAKMPVATFNELAKELPNTSHIPQAHSGNAAIFTLFGKKELTGSAPGQPSQTGLREMMAASAPDNAPIKPVAVTAPTRINRFMTEGFKKKF